MKQKLKIILQYLISCAISFVLIYIFVFLGGWRFFESGDPILIEIGVSLGAGFIFWIIWKTTQLLEEKIKELEKRIEQLERR